MDLTKRREAVLTRHRTLASVPGSGWHRDDPSESKRIARGLPALCERVIAMQDDDTVHVVGADVAIVKKGMSEYLARAEKRIAALPVGSAAPAVDIQAIKIVKQTLAAAGEIISLPTNLWNAALHALADAGVHCVLADANATESE